MKNLIKVVTVAVIAIFVFVYSRISPNVPDRKLNFDADIATASFYNIADSAFISRSNESHNLNDSIIVIVPAGLFETAKFNFNDSYSEYIAAVEYRSDENIEFYVLESFYTAFITEFSRNVRLYLENLQHENSYINGIEYLSDYSQITVFLNKDNFDSHNRFALYSSFALVKIYRIFELNNWEESDIFIKIVDSASDEIIDIIYY